MTDEFFNVESFFEVVDDPAVFQFKQYNLFKAFYFAFEHRILNQLTKKHTTPRRDLGWALRRPIRFIQASVQALCLATVRRTQPRMLIYRSLRDELIARLVDYKGRSRFIIIQDHRASGLEQQSLYRADLYVHDFAILIALFYLVVRLIFARDLRRFSKTIVSRYGALGFDRGEIVNKVALFYAKSLTHRLLLTILRPKRAFLISHYGKEAFIAACQDRDIPAVELMHGALIAHPQYNFPASYGHLFQQALFPDKLSVFGEYWKQIAVQGNMFPEEAILVGGYHLKLPDETIGNTKENLPEDRSIIMISGQGIFTQQLCNYISFLKRNLDPTQWHILIKPHPHKDPNAYDAVLEPGFVTRTDTSPYRLLPHVDIHISLYSTLLYEAVRYNVANYVLLVDGAPTICHRIIESGVAYPLELHQLPEIDARLDEQDAKRYFADFRPSVLFEEEE